VAWLRQRGLKQVTDLGAIEKIVDDIIAKPRTRWRRPRTTTKLIGWFVGQV